MRYYFADLTFGDEFCEMEIECNVNDFEIIAYKCAEELSLYLGLEIDLSDISNWPRKIGISTKKGSPPIKIFKVDMIMEPNYIVTENT